MIAELTFWEWAARQGYSLVQLANKLGYNADHLSRIKNGRVPVSVEFAARCVLVFGDCARQFFLDVMPVTNHTPSRLADSADMPAATGDITAAACRTGKAKEE